MSLGSGKNCVAPEGNSDLVFVSELLSSVDKGTEYVRTRVAFPGTSNSAELSSLGFSLGSGSESFLLLFVHHDLTDSKICWLVAYAFLQLPLQLLLTELDSKQLLLKWSVPVDKQFS